MKNKTGKFTFRTDSEELRKFHYVADYNGRSSNREMEILIRQHVAAFEKEHGTIILDEKK